MIPAVNHCDPSPPLPLTTLKGAQDVLLNAGSLTTPEGLPVAIESLPFGTSAHPVPSPAPPVSLIPLVPKRRKK